jgi:MFS family permease
MIKSISQRNSKLYIISHFCQALWFVIPIWIVYYRGFVSTTEIAFIAGWAYFIQLIMELPTGAFADMVGKRWSVILSYLLTAIGMFMIPFAHTFAHFLLIESLVGIGSALFSGAQEALLYDSLKQEGNEADFSRVMTKDGFWYQIGLMVSTGLGGIMYTYGHLIPFIASAASAVLGMCFAWMFVEPKIDTEKFSFNNYINQIRLGVHEIKKNTETLLLSSYYIAVGSLTWVCQTFFNSYLLIDLGFGDQTRGYISAGLRLFNIVVLMRLMKNEKIFNHKNTFIFFPILMILAMLPGVFLNGIWGIPTVAGVMMASTARWILLAKYTNEVYDSKYRATAISTLSMAIGLISVIATTASGPIMAHFGGARTIFSILGFISAITIIPLVTKILKLPRYAQE